MAIATTLHSKKGALAPSTIASQVSVNDSNGSASTVDAEIINLRKGIADVSAGATTVHVQTKTVETEIASGASYSVPEYAIGSGKLSVYMDGILCVAGIEYVEESSTSITFTGSIPVGIEITVRVIS